ncbi:hypothetical protein A7982_13351 [Minicystis rosea]|nr:hypothetical protein A7982_13351 [Minicystis rosea]
MTAPYRDETDALTLRLQALLEQLEVVRAQTQSLTALAEVEKQIEQEIEDVRGKLAQAVAGPKVSMLDDARIASPCPADWNSMIGDERTRLCLQCDKEVHNLAGMTREEAEAFLGGVVGEVCLRIYRRADGTVLTSDCPVGVQKKRRRLALVSAVVGGAVASSSAFLMMHPAASPPVGCRMPPASSSVTEAPVVTAAPVESAAPAEPRHHVVPAGVAPPPNVNRQLSYQTQELSRLLDQRAKTTDPAKRRDIESRIRDVQQTISRLQKVKKTESTSL